MKKFFLFTFILLASRVTAQEIQIQSNLNAHKFVVENISSTEKHTFYAYGEIAFSNSFSTYLQTFYEYNLGAVSPHIEYRSLLFQDADVSNSLLLGASVKLFERDTFYVSIAPLYRYEKMHMWQGSLIYGVYFNKLTIEGYFDAYGQNNVNAFSENKLKYNIGNCFVGFNIEYSLFDGHHKLTPYVMFGVKI